MQAQADGQPVTRTDTQGEPRASGGHPALERLRAVVLLAGSVRANQLRKSSGRSPLELPVDNHRSVLQCWRDELIALAERLGLEELRARVMVDRGSGMNPGTRRYGPIKLSIETDPFDFRGTGGLLSDIAREYRDDDLILVAHASQLLFEPLSELTEALARPGADVSLMVAERGTPAGLTLLRCGCLRDINPIGFVDLNEQAMPAIAARHDVRVVRYDRPVTRSLRTLGHYISTLREHHRRLSGRLMDEGPFVEDWRPSFEIIEPGAAVHERAVVHDSVVLAGARVEADVVLVRCLVCPGAVVAEGRSELDRVVGARTGLPRIG